MILVLLLGISFPSVLSRNAAIIELPRYKLPKASSFSTLILSKHGQDGVETIFLGGNQTLLKLEFDGRSFKNEQKRIITKENPEALNEKFAKCRDKKNNDNSANYSVFVNNLVEVGDFLMFCTNVTEICSLIDPQDFQGHPKWSKPTGMSPFSGPSRVRVQELADNHDFIHRVLYIAKPNMHSPDSNSAKLCENLNVLSMIEMSTSVFYPNQDKAKDLYTFLRSTRSNQEDPINIQVNMEDKPQVSFVELFTVIESMGIDGENETISHMSWIYYVSKVSKEPKEFGDRVSFVIGRTCTADVELLNVAEIPITCGEINPDIIMAKYDEVTETLLVLNNVGHLCIWTITELENMFNAMSKSCWYLKGCTNINDGELCPSSHEEAKVVETRSQGVSVAQLVHKNSKYLVDGKENNSQCRGKQENEKLVEWLKACPDADHKKPDNNANFVFCPLEYKDLPRDDRDDPADADKIKIPKVPYICSPNNLLAKSNVFLIKSDSVAKSPLFDLGNYFRTKYRSDDGSADNFNGKLIHIHNKITLFVSAQDQNEIIIWSFDKSELKTGKHLSQKIKRSSLTGFPGLIRDFTIKHNKIFALTPSELTVRNIHNCEEHTDCHSCLNSYFPSCGWCSKRGQGQCTDKSTCEYVDPDNWIGQNGVCPTLEPYNRKFLSANKATIQLRLKLKHNFEREDLWKCNFAKHKTKLTFEGKTEIVNCELPSDKKSFLGAAVDDIFKVKDLQVTYDDTLVAETNASFYDCSIVNESRSCTSCLSHEDWTCYWNRRLQSCVDDKPDVIDNIERGMCPSVSAVEPIKTVYADMDMSEDIPIEINNEDGKALGNCSIYIADKLKLEREATRGKNGIICKDISMAVETSFDESVRIEYAIDNYKFDSLSTEYFRLKDCGFKKPSCTQCQVRLGCSMVNNKCVKSTGDSSNQKCPPPVIHKITPTSGLTKALTPFVITGQQLFTDPDDVVVLVGKHDCEIDKEQTFSEIDGEDNSLLSQITCRLPEGITFASEYEVTIVRNADNDSRTIADQKILITEPEVINIYPKYGLVSGMTRLKLTGKDFDVGAQRDVMVGDQRCIIDVVTPETITCSTPEVKEKTELGIELIIDGRSFGTDNTFTYVSKPELVNKKGLVHMCDLENSCSAITLPVPAYLSGGGEIWFTLTGKDLEKVVSNGHSVPIIYVDDEDLEMDKVLSEGGDVPAKYVDYVSRCDRGKLPIPLVSPLKADLRGSAVMPPTSNDSFDFKCDLPKIQQIRRRRRRSSEERFLTIRLDGWTNSSIELDVFGAPEIVRTLEDREFSTKSYENVTICFSTIEAAESFGKYSWSSTSITIDPGTMAPIPPNFNLELNGVNNVDKKCSSIEFKLPVELERKTFNEERYPLKVRFGSIHTEFATLVVKPTFSFTTIAIVIVVIVVIFFIVALIVYPLYTKYRATQKKHMSLEKKLHAVEEKVSVVARRAYFELSMELPEIVEDNAQMPVQPYSTFINRVLFPNPQDAVPLKTYPDAKLMQLKNLLNDQTFTEKAIRAMESQPGCTSRDKTKIASYIMSIFSDNPRFITKLTFALVDTYLKDSVGRTPKLAFRFSNEVIERLIGHWMHLTLYDFLYSDTGRSLWVLLRAIKQQGWKGPVDAVKGHAQFTLTENRLLKEDIEYHPMKLSVIPPGIREDSSEPSYVFVQILDCDTITQVKEKCMDAVYSNEPYSKWPKSEEIALEFRIKRVKVPLVEGQSQPDASNRHRYMTVKDYNIKENNVIAMVQKKVIESTSSDMLPHEADTRETDPLRGDRELGDTYHLVKPGDENRQSVVDLEFNTFVSDLYLQRLITSKQILQPYVDKFFNYILLDEPNSTIPPPFKYLFDFLDKAAKSTLRPVGTITSQTADIEDALPYWKTNCLILRFWVNIMTNPTFFLDVPVPDLVNSSVTVVASTLMECAQGQEQQVNEQDPVNRMLFQKTINQYGDKVRKFYKKVQDAPPITQEEVIKYIENDLYATYKTPKTNQKDSLACLLTFVSKYESQIASNLEDDLGDTPEVQKLIAEMSRICSPN